MNSTPVSRRICACGRYFYIQKKKAEEFFIKKQIYIRLCKHYHRSPIQPLSHRWFLIKGIKAFVCPLAVLRSCFGYSLSHLRTAAACLSRCFRHRRRSKAKPLRGSRGGYRRTPQNFRGAKAPLFTLKTPHYAASSPNTKNSGGHCARRCLRIYFKR